LGNSPAPASLEELMTSLQRLRRLFASRQVTSRTLESAAVDVSHQGAALLQVLLRAGRLSIAALAGLAAMDLGAVSRQVRLLERAGAVRRSASPDDGRVTLLELTAAGRRMAQRIGDVGARHMQEALHDWSQADQRALAQLLDRLVDDLVHTPLPVGPGVGRSGRVA
jgi:DNA-binding MarR family transcriptional regulator